MYLELEHMAAQLYLFPQPKPPIATVENPAPMLAPVRAERGDLWQLGKHRVLCGDATSLEDVARLMGGVDVDSCITDPPYGIKWDSDHTRFTKDTRVWGRYRTRAPIANDSRPFNPDHLLRFRRLVLWGANNYAADLPAGSWLVWDKRHASGKAFLADGEAAWMRGGRGVYIHSHTWQGLIRKIPEPFLHPTQKPIALMEWCMSKAKAGAAVFDPYCGSGPALMACERTGRACYAIEIEPHYCDVILRRWEQSTGQHAILLERRFEDGERQL